MSIKNVAIEETEALEESKQAIQPRWLRIPTAAHYSGMCRSFLYQAMGSGKLKSRKVGTIRIIDRLSLDAFIESQDAGGIDFVKAKAKAKKQAARRRVQAIITANEARRHAQSD